MSATDPYAEDDPLHSAHCEEIHSRTGVPIGELEPGIHEVFDHNELVIVVTGIDDVVYLTSNPCAHRSGNPDHKAFNLSVEGRICQATRSITCYHRPRRWDLITGRNTSDLPTPDMPIIPTLRFDGRLFLTHEPDGQR